MSIIKAVPDWARLRSDVPKVSVSRLTALLESLDGAEKQVFALRGMAALIVEERELYKYVLDEEAGDNFRSFDKWLKFVCPQSWGYVREALRAVRELKDVPFEDLLEMSRANIKQLEKVSGGVRALPEVVEAAKTLPEAAFIAQVNADHQQHLERKRPVILAPEGDADEFDRAVKVAMLIEGCGRSEALKAIGIEYLQNHQAEIEVLIADGELEEVCE